MPIEKPKIKTRDIHELTGAIYDAKQERLYQAGIDYCYKEMAKWLNKQESSRKDVDFVTLIIDKRDWQALQGLEG